MRWFLHVTFGACAALGLVSCDSVMTIGPTPSTDGIVIYLHADYVGTSQQLAVDIEDLGHVEGPCVEADDNSATARWDDCISSIRVMPGWRATLYRDTKFKGSSLVISEDTPNLDRLPGPCSGSFNDCVSSIRVSRQ